MLDILLCCKASKFSYTFGLQHPSHFLYLLCQSPTAVQKCEEVIATRRIPLRFFFSTSYLLLYWDKKSTGEKSWKKAPHQLVLGSFFLNSKRKKKSTKMYFDSVQTEHEGNVKRTERTAPEESKYHRLYYQVSCNKIKMTDRNSSINLYNNSAYACKPNAFFNMHHEETYTC